MGSQRGPALSPPAASPTLEAKVDSLASKLDLFLGRGHAGGCPVCLACSVHVRQQEATERQLCAQSKQLEKLERRMGEMQRSLDVLVRGGQEEKQNCANQGATQCMEVLTISQPQEATSLKTSPLPARTQLVTVKNPLGCPQPETNKPQNIKLPGPAIPPKKGTAEQRDQEVATVNQKPIGGGTQVDQPTIEPAVVTITTSTTVTQKTKSTLATEKQQEVHREQAPKQPTLSTPTKKSDGPVGGLWLIGGNSQEVKGQPMAELHRQSKGGTAVTVQSMQATPSSKSISVTGKGDTPIELQVNRPQEPKQPPLIVPSKKGEGLAKGAHVIGRNPPEVKRQPITEPLSQREEVGVAETAAAAVAVQSVASDQKSQSAFGQSKAAAMVTSVTAPQKPCGLAVPMVTLESPSLRHVSSCPESLQRFQGASRPQATAQPVWPGQGPALGKSCSVARGSSPHSPGPGPDCGIQIRISPAAPDTTKPTPSLPQICHKVIDDVPPQPAPFPHRCVSLRSNPASDTFTIHTREVLGGGRFGKVHRCTERSSGLKLAAKVINTRNAKEKEMAMNELQVMNQLSHANILQLYEAFETKNQVVLILEYVEGGELFDRIVDESSPLTEVDAMVFVKQICEGIHYMHQMYVLHLDLKPENILCVNRTGHQVKIIDFGLARRYRPREKLRVNFGTPEFLAPEVVNFDFVSFPTDMWTLGVVTYMLVSGMSPFLGDDDSQTLSNVLAVNWYFDEEACEHVSSEARDFIANLLIREKGGRMSATQCLKHPWLNNISEKARHNNIVLKSQVLLKKYMAKRLWKKNYIAIAAANRLKKISSSGSLTSLGV